MLFMLVFFSNLYHHWPALRFIPVLASLFVAHSYHYEPFGSICISHPENTVPRPSVLLYVPHLKSSQGEPKDRPFPFTCKRAPQKFAWTSEWYTRVLLIGSTLWYKLWTYGSLRFQPGQSFSILCDKSLIIGNVVINYVWSDWGTP